MCLFGIYNLLYISEALVIGEIYFHMKHTFYLVSFFTRYINYCKEI